MIRKEVQERTDELAELAIRMDYFTQEDDEEVGEAEAVANIIEYCDKICSMATAI